MSTASLPARNRVEETSSIHASAFAYHGFGCLLMGVSGSGKSRLLADALLHGAHMIADDQVQLRLNHSTLEASAPPRLAGILELRGFGLIRVAPQQCVAAHPLHLILTLDVAHDIRLPEPATHTFLGVALPHLRLAPVPVTAIAPVLLYIKAMQEGRILPPDWLPQG